MLELLRTVWNELQTAESRLVRAGVDQDPEALRALFARLPMERESRALLLRLAFGFDPARLSTRDYLVRYPFSTLEALEAELAALAGQGYLERSGDEAFALSQAGEELVRAYYDVIAGGIDQLELPSLPPAEIDFLLEMDRRLMEGVAARTDPAGWPVLHQRLHGFHPAYEPPKLSHHWQRTWTLIAAQEDAEEAVRRQSGLEPLAWFARRQVWRNRFEIGSAEDLVHTARRYAPVSEAACAQTLAGLERAGWIAGTGEGYNLTEAGSELLDRSEAQIDQLFFSVWPELDGRDMEHLREVASRLNAALPPT